MYSATVVAQPYQPTSLELPGGRAFTVVGNGAINPELLELTPRQDGLITSILDERVVNLLTFEADTPGKEWKTGRDAFLSASFYLPSGPRPGRENPRQVVDASWERREVKLITSLNDNHLQRHEIQARFDECGRIIPETVRASVSLVLEDHEYFLADGQRFDGGAR